MNKVEKDAASWWRVLPLSLPFPFSAKDIVCKKSRQKDVYCDTVA
jgi:hypothetical protein